MLVRNFFEKFEENEFLKSRLSVFIESEVEYIILKISKKSTPQSF